MNRSFPIISKNIAYPKHEPGKTTAIHEAGHAAAIYIGNKEKKLPPIYFHIDIKEQSRESQPAGYFGPAQTQYYAKVEGGRLIHTLPSSIYEATRHLSESEKKAYQSAFEADMINFLVGPLAEAKYVSLCDNKLINPRLIDLDSLHFFGGSTDLKTVREYLDCLLPDPTQREMKMTELFLSAYHFISNKTYWSAITALSDYILKSGKNIIECEEAISILNTKMS